MALPNKHQLKFNIHKDAKSLMEAIEKRSKGNKETKKVQKTLLKQQYENFSGTSSKSLNKIHDRLQKLISQLEILGESISQEDINMEFLRSLPSEWKTHTLIWKNKADLEEQSSDDLFINLKIYETEVNSSSPTSHNTQNIAFMSSNNTDSTNESVSVVPSVSAASSKALVSTLPNVDNLSDAVIYSFFVSQSNSPQLDNEDLKQIDADDLEEMDLNAYHESQEVSSKDWKESRSPKDNRNKDTLRRTVPVEASTSNALVSQCDGVGSYDWSFQADEEPTNYALMAFTSSSSSSSLGFDNEVFDCDELNSSESDDSVPSSLVHDRYKSDESEPESVSNQKEPSFVQTSEHVKTPRASVKTVEHPTQAENLRIDNQKSRANGSQVYVEQCTKGESSPFCKGISSHSNRNVVPTAVLTRSVLVSLNAARPVTTAVPKSTVKSPRPVKHVVNKAHSPIRRPINHRLAPKTSNFNKKVTTVKVSKVNAVKGTKGNWGNPHQALKDKVVINSGFSRHMTRNISYLSNFEEINRGYVSFGGNAKGGKITGIGKIKTSKLDFDDVYFVKELKFNLFSVSQMCDKKNNVLFTDTECVVLSSDFKLPDKNHVLFRVPRENNMYNVDLKNVVPSGDLTCLFAKATLDESYIWHRRLGHINFKTMNKLVKGNLVRGLPSKFRGMKRIKREFSVARTPQQNEVAERKNRTLIEAARTMLADSLFPIPFWAEADEGFLVGYSVNSKEFKVFNSRTRIVQETLHINFLENQPNVAGSGPIWLFDIDTLTHSMNYQPVIVRNQPNHSAGIKENLDAGKVGKETESAQQYVLLPLLSTGSKDPQNTDADAVVDVKENDNEVHW
nr:ribonuclease H-like domain-containing protein [Tanacetum cinerariifolium]